MHHGLQNVRWRLSRAPKQIWRPVVISAAGTTLMWVIAMTLWLPSINYGKTYRDVAQAAALAYLPWCAAVPFLGIAAWQLDGLFLGTTQGRALRNAGILSAILYIGADLMLRPQMGNAGVWTAFLLMYLFRATALGLYVPGLFRDLSRRLQPVS